jgi:drug/metabolite transporter (DMT)-like permease
MASVVLGIWLLFSPSKEQDETRKNVNQEQRRYITVLGLLLGALLWWSCLTLWGWSLTQTTLANSTILHNLTPLFTCIGEWIFLRQKFDQRFILGMALALVGGISLGIDDWHITSSNLIGDIAALGSALLYSGYLVIIGKVRSSTNMSAAHILFYCSSLGAVLSLPVLIIEGQGFFPSTLYVWVWVAILGVLCQALGHGMLAYSLKKFTSGFIAVGLLLESIMSALLGLLVFSEIPGLFSLLMFVLIIFGLYLAKTSRSALRDAEA